MAYILVTGGAGFIGSHLVDALVTQGHRVSVVDKESVKPERRNGAVFYKKGDIRDDATAAWIEQERPECVFHLAAYIDDRAGDAMLIHDNNVTGSLKVYEAAARAGTKKIIFASSCAVYGNQEQMPVSEDARIAPLTPYGRSKYMGEQYLEAYKTSERSVTALRFANVYGPRQDGSKESGAVAVFTQHILEKKPFFLNGDGSTVRDYIYVGDVVDALCVAMEKGISGVINIGTGRGLTTKEVLLAVEHTAQERATYTLRPEVRDAVARMVLETTRAQTQLHWTAKTTSEEGIVYTVGWYREKRKAHI